MSSDAHEIAEAASHLADLIDAAMGGAEVVIARGGVPAVRLVPVAAPARRVPGAWEGRTKVHDPHWWKPDDELADLFGIGPASQESHEPPAR